MGGVERGEVALPADMEAAARALARPEDVMGFLDGFVEYGCIDADGVRHVDSLGGENFRAAFRTLSLSRSLEERIGACIEQTNITRYLLGRMGVACRTFFTRGYSAGHPAPHDAYLVHCFTIALPQGARRRHKRLGVGRRRRFQRGGEAAVRAGPRRVA